MNWFLIIMGFIFVVIEISIIVCNLKIKKSLEILSEKLIEIEKIDKEISKVTKEIIYLSNKIVKTQDF